MYEKYCEKKNFTFQPISVTSDGEFLRDCCIRINGPNVNKFLKFESGIHRVQRVPKTGIIL